MEPQSPVSEKTTWVTPKRSRIQRPDVLSCRLATVSACLSFAFMVFIIVIRRHGVALSGVVGLGVGVLFLVAAVLGVAGFSLGIVALRRRGALKRFAIVGVVFSLLALLLTFSGSAIYAIGRSMDGVSHRSCIGHLRSFVGGSLEQLVQKDPDVILPATDDTITALQTLMPDCWDRRDPCIAACPDSHDAKGGYIYIGDGLRLRDVAQKNIPILFCPASSHRQSVDICRAWPPGEDGMANVGIIFRLEDALARSKSGEFSYSPRAIAVLEREIAARKVPPGGPIGRFIAWVVFAISGFCVGVVALVWKCTRSRGPRRECV